MKPPVERPGASSFFVRQGILKAEAYVRRGLQPLDSVFVNIGGSMPIGTS